MTGRITLKLLEKHYPVVHTLEGYLNLLLGAALTVSESPKFATLLSTSFVARVTDRTLPSFKHALQPTQTTIGAVIEQAIHQLLKNVPKKGRNANLIVRGYKLNNPARSITNTYPNNNVLALQSPEWEMLCSRIGIDAMMHLLTETCLFVALPNDCLCQLAGEPITRIYLDNMQLSVPAAVKRTSSDLDEDVPRKRRKLNNGAAAFSQPRERPPSKVYISRTRMFYGRGRKIGLPPSHILNQPYTRPKLPHGSDGPPVAMEVHGADDARTPPDPTIQLEAARNLSKYVFPRQYGLANAFRVEQHSPAPDHNNRVAEIKALGRCKTPKRLKDAVVLLEKVLWRHGTTRYWQLRDLACPSQVRDLRKKGVREQDILAYFALKNSQEGDSEGPRTQPEYNAHDASYDTEGNTIQPMGLTQAEEQARLKPPLAEFASAHGQVFRYAMLVTKSVFPSAIWGTHDNFLHIMKKVKTFISCRRFETLSIHNILQGYSTSGCDWLMPRAPQQRVAATDALKRRELLEDFVYWYFDGFLMPLLKNTFYITESSATRNHVMYFRKDDWEFLCRPLVENLAEKTFKKIEPEDALEMLRHRQLGFSFVRLLPKENGVRPIANLRRRYKVTNKGVLLPGAGSTGRETSINNILQGAFKILNYERDTRRNLVGASTFSMNETYIRLKEFKSRFQGPLPQLYLVKVDVQACFDTIPQGKLIEILRTLLTEEAYTLQKFSKVTSGVGIVKKESMMRAKPQHEDTDFLHLASQLASALHSTIFVDQVASDTVARNDVLALLEQHITQHLVKIGPNYYQQTVGIPQGSVLSSLLCAFFYGDLERRFGAFMDDPGSMLIRQTDDYLFVSTSKDRARAFLEMMNKGHPEYGCFISQDKTVTNFDFDGSLQSLPQVCEFPWCGMLLHSKNLTVSVEYARNKGLDLAHTLTISRRSKPGAFFRHKMLGFAKGRSHLIYNDLNLNTGKVVYRNIYENFLLCALRMNLYLREWGLDTRKHASFLWETVHQMIAYADKSIRNKNHSRLAQDYGGRTNLDKGAVTWLGMHAFRAILGKQPTRWAALLKKLDMRLTVTIRNRRYARRFGKLTSEGLERFLECFVTSKDG